MTTLLLSTQDWPYTATETCWIILSSAAALGFLLYVWTKCMIELSNKA